MSMEPAINSASQTPPPPRERRQHPRLSVDTRAFLVLVEVGARLPGRILNVSMGGCLILTDNRFPTGVYRRIEVEFSLHGMPFRMAGVTQGIYDRRRVGVRFLDLSDRKRDQLRQLLREIAASVAPDPPPEGGA
jgi:hypothetical protein